MKTAKMILPIAFVIAIASVITLQSCKKNSCYECTRTDPTNGTDNWNMCDKDSHDNAIAAGYSCHEVDR